MRRGALQQLIRSGLHIAQQQECQAFRIAQQFPFRNLSSLAGHDMHACHCSFPERVQYNGCLLQPLMVQQRCLFSLPGQGGDDCNKDYKERRLIGSACFSIYRPFSRGHPSLLPGATS